MNQLLRQVSIFEEYDMRRQWCDSYRAVGWENQSKQIIEMSLERRQIVSQVSDQWFVAE